MADGLCSADEEEDLDTDMHSPTDVSEDSIEVKVKPITSLIGGCKSKRKCAEPRKFGDEVKRRVVDLRSVNESEYGPFRPWSQTPSGYVPHGYSTKPPDRDQEEPLALVLRGNTPRETPLERLAPDSGHSNNAKCQPRPQEVVRLHNRTLSSSAEESRSISRVQEDFCDKSRTFSVESLICAPGPSSSTSSIAGDKRKSSLPQQQRNYKNMTRERRIEANARERTRVHTISAAFDTLRRAVPAYSHNQKLSKLSVLRIACSYILTLSRVAGSDYSADNSQPSLSDCVENVSRTIQLEGKLRKKKDE